MRVTFHGVRGSTPVHGDDTRRYGGNTSCVSVDAPGELPLVFDMGTGLRYFGERQPHDGTFRGTCLLSHLHWDHTQGLPFFAAGRHVDSDVTVLVPTAEDPVEVLARAMGPPHFPVRPDELSGGWRFGSIGEGQWEIEGFSVTARAIPHLDSVTLGLRVSDGTSTLAYLSDHRPLTIGPGPEGLGVYHDAAMDLADGADVLIHALATESSVILRATRRRSMPARSRWVMIVVRFTSYWRASESIDLPSR